MKKFCLLILMILPAITHGQVTWQEINTGYNYILTDISFPPGQSQVGYTVGKDVSINGLGIILKTTDEGQTWTQISASGIPGLEAVCFTSETNGYVGGWSNYLAKTTDGGLSWTQIPINPFSVYVKEIDFYDDDHGIVSCHGNYAFVTADGGNTWTASTGITTSFEDVDYITSYLLYAVGANQIIQRSADGGLTWWTFFSGITGNNFTGIDFIDANNGVVGGNNGEIWVCTNGINWDSYVVGADAIYHGVKMIDTDNIYVAGTPAMLYRTSDNGTTWISEYPGGGNLVLNKIIILPSGIGLACGSEGKILRGSTMYASITYTPGTICQGDSIQFISNNYGNINSWNWFFPGGTPSSSFLQNPVVVFNSILFNNIDLTVSDGVNFFTTQSNFSVNPSPQPVITGPELVCKYSLENYYTPNNQWSTYTWNISPGGFIVSGQNTNQLEVQWGWPGFAKLSVEEINNIGCSDSVSIAITIDPCNGISKTTDNQMSVYPNPVSSILKLDNPENINNISLFSPDGICVYPSASVPSNGILDISDLAAGFYILKINTISGKEISYKLLKTSL